MEKKLYIFITLVLFVITFLRFIDSKNRAKRPTGTVVTKKVPMVILTQTSTPESH
jgi:hypothetical protein